MKLSAHMVKHLLLLQSMCKYWRLFQFSKFEVHRSCDHGENFISEWQKDTRTQINNPCACAQLIMTCAGFRTSSACLCSHHNATNVRVPVSFTSFSHCAVMVLKTLILQVSWHPMFSLQSKSCYNKKRLWFWKEPIVVVSIAQSCLAEFIVGTQTLEKSNARKHFHHAEMTWVYLMVVDSLLFKEIVNNIGIYNVDTW